MRGRRKLITHYGRSANAILSLASTLKIPSSELPDNTIDGKSIHLTAYGQHFKRVDLYQAKKLKGYHRAQYVLSCMLINYVPSGFDFFILNVSILTVTQYVLLIDLLNYESDEFRYEYLNRKQQLSEAFGEKYGAVYVSLDDEEIAPEEKKPVVDVDTKPMLSLTLDLFGLRVELKGEYVSSTHISVSGINISKV
jgi:hypothetical protein